MSDYTDIIFLIGGILLFSIFSMQANNLLIRNNIIQSQSSVEYLAATQAQQYADLITTIESETELDNFLSEFPRYDTIQYDDQDTTRSLTYYVDIQSTNITLPSSTVSSEEIEILLKNEFLNSGSGTIDSEYDYQVKLMKSFK